MQTQTITLKSLFKLVLQKRPALIYGQILALIAIIISVPIPLLLPVMVDEVLLDKPEKIVPLIEYLFGGGNAFYYIAMVTLGVILLRFIYYAFGVVITKIFTKISKHVTFMIRKKLLEHLKISSMNEYEVLGSGAITSNLVTDVNTLDAFIISSVSKFVSSVLTMIAVGIVMIAIDPVLGLLILIIQPLIMLVSKQMSKKVGFLKKEENAAIEKFQESVGETLDLYGQIKASKRRVFLHRRYK